MQNYPGEQPPASNSQTNILGGCGFLVSLLLIPVGVYFLAAAIFFIVSPCGNLGISAAQNHLKQLGLALHDYHHVHQSLPPGGSMNANQETLHSWMTLILPFHQQQALFQQIDQTIPWNHAVNAKHFKIEIESFLSRDIEKHRTAEGFAMSHYSANNKLLLHNSHFTMNEISDGTSNTLMAGEIKQNLPAWGDPSNRRDFALGLNEHPQGFGGPYPTGVLVLFADGHVSTLPDDIDRSILKALSTPAGGEQIPDIDY